MMTEVCNFTIGPLCSMYTIELFSNGGRRVATATSTCRIDALRRALKKVRYIRPS